MFLTVKPYLHLNCVFMLNWIVWNGTVFTIYCVKKTVLIYIYKIGFGIPGSNTPQDTNCTATCPLSRKLFKLDEPDMQDTAGEAEMNS